TTCATRRSREIRLSRSIRRIRRAVWSSGRCSPSLHSIASGDGETIATSYPRASIAITAFSAARSWRGEIRTMRQSRGKNRVRTQAACVDHDHDVAGPLPLVLVRIEAVEPSGRLPVDPANLIARGILADAPKVRPFSQQSGRNLSEPGAGAPRLELRAPEVFHRRRDDETRVRRENGILGAEGERIEGPHAHGPDAKIAFDGRPHRVGQRHRAAALQGNDRVV